MSTNKFKTLEEMKRYHKNVDWNLWNVSSRNLKWWCFSLKTSPPRKPFFQFVRRSVVYQLVWDHKDYDLVDKCDVNTLSHILDDWAVGKIYMRLRL